MSHTHLQLQSLQNSSSGPEIHQALDNSCESDNERVTQALVGKQP